MGPPLPPARLTPAVRRSPPLLLILLVGFLEGLGSLSARAEPRPPGAPAWVLVVQGDRLTVELKGVPLGAVLADLARQAGLRVALSEATGQDLVSARFRNMPLDQGIRRLLGPRSYVLVYAPRASGPSAPGPGRISEVMVLSGQDQQRAGDSVDALTYALVDPDERVRARAQGLWEEALASEVR